tara:strand:+ start:437 stop:1477 length:1041 start_codon:yes stop_codon:yes gene_type:complete
MNSNQKKKINYQSSGVSIDRADKLINSIKSNRGKKDKNIISGIGGFSSLYQIDNKIKNPVIVSGTDGVGTKLKIASRLNIHKYIGQDLVAMCVNDVITSGAKPLFFLDYLATSRIRHDLHSDVLAGIKRACKSCNISLIGGETAEMPGMYANNDYDLAGFCVGIVSKEKIITQKKVKDGDLVIGIPSSGFHSNGYSLINKLIDKKRLKLNEKFGNSSIGNILIKPTKLYVNIIAKLSNKIKINGLAHITGGGITDNLPRIIPDNLAACIDLKSIKFPSIFRHIQKLSKIDDYDMLKTFNCGTGMIIVINKKYLSIMHSIFKSEKQAYRVIGQIIKKPDKSNIIYVD